MPDKHKQKQSLKTLPTFTVCLLPLSLSALVGGGRTHAIMHNLFLSRQFGVTRPAEAISRAASALEESFRDLQVASSGYGALSTPNRWSLSISSNSFTFVPPLWCCFTPLGSFLTNNSSKIASNGKQLRVSPFSKAPNYPTTL